MLHHICTYKAKNKRIIHYLRGHPTNLIHKEFRSDQHQYQHQVVPVPFHRFMTNWNTVLLFDLSGSIGRYYSSIMASQPSTTTGTIAAVESISRTINDLDTTLLSEILSFAGPNQYYFIATIDRRFKETYSQVFPNNKMSFVNASTVEHAKFCYELLISSNA